MATTFHSMIKNTKLLAAVLGLSLVSGSIGCRSDEDSNRWVTTQNTNVKLDWDKVNEAYKLAEGPEDLIGKVRVAKRFKCVPALLAVDHDFFAQPL